MRAEHEAYSVQVRRIQAALRQAGWGTSTQEGTATRAAHATVLDANRTPPPPPVPSPPVSAVLRARDVNATACTTSRKTGGVDCVGAPSAYRAGVHATRSAAKEGEVALTRSADAPPLFQRLMGDADSDSTVKGAPATSGNLFDELIAKAWGGDAASALPQQRRSTACTTHTESPAAQTSSSDVSVSSRSSSAAAAVLPRGAASASAAAPSSAGEVGPPQPPKAHVVDTTNTSSRVSRRRPPTRITSAVGQEAASAASAVTTCSPLACSVSDPYAPDVGILTASAPPPPSAPRCASSSRPASRVADAAPAAAGPSQRQIRLLRAVQLTEAALQRGTGVSCSGSGSRSGGGTSRPLLVRLRDSGLGHALQALTDAHGRTLMPRADALTRAEVSRLRDRLVRELLASHTAPGTGRRASPSPPHVDVVERTFSGPQESSAAPMGSASIAVGTRGSIAAPHCRTPSASPVAAASCASAMDRERGSSMSLRAPSRDAFEVAAAAAVAKEEEDPYVVSLQRFAQEAAALRAVQERSRHYSAACSSEGAE